MTIPRDLPTNVLAFRLYGDADRDLEIETRNKINGLAAGSTLVLES